MRKQWTRTLALLCALALVLTLAAPGFADETATPGQVLPDGSDDDGFIRGTEEGSDYRWKLDEDGTLTIKGTKMADWYYDEPWHANCASIRKAVVEQGITNIGEYAFYVCAGLTEITIPEGMTSIGSYAFSGCSGLTEITIPEGMTSIGWDAFSGCSGLTEITIPASVTSIGGSAFAYCSGLTEITIPEGVTSIGSYAFSGCSGLTEITIPENVTSIGWSAFSGCSGLTSITIPEGVTSIGSYAFDDCTSLTSITILEGVTSIGSSAFAYCSGLTEITIPASVTSIGDSAFYGCSGLTEITIPEGVTSIGWEAFSGCSGLTEITIPEGVTSIGSYAFSGCSGLTEINVATGNPNYCSVQGILYNKGQTEIIQVPGGIQGTVMIPEGVTSIGSYAFWGCSGLTEITIPSSVTNIDMQAFSDCNHLERVFFAGEAPQFDTWAFLWCNTSIYYPQDDPTWTEEVRRQYGGTLTWVPYDPANPPDLTPEEPEQPAQSEPPEEPETPSEPEQPAQPETPEEPEQPAQPETPANTVPEQIADDLAQQVIAAAGNYDLARQLLESLLGNRDISVSARITEAMRTAIERAGGVARGHQVTDSAYVYATYPQSFAEALRFARAEVNAAANSFTLDMNFPEGKQSPLGVYMTVYLKEAFDPTLEYRWYCSDGSVGAARVEVCDNNGYKACAKFYAPHFSVYTVQPVGGADPFAPAESLEPMEPSAPTDPAATVEALAPAAVTESPVLKKTGGNVSPAMGVVLALAAAAVLGCALARKRKRKTL